jgi:AraC-like DNA-binding protein
MSASEAQEARGVGRPRVEIDMDTLRQLVMIQCTATECASVLGVSVDTIDRRLKEEFGMNFAEFFEKHSGEGKASLRRMQWKSAKDGNVTMQIWLGKQLLEQRDKHAVTGDNGDPIETINRIRIEYVGADG